MILSCFGRQIHCRPSSWWHVSISTCSSSSTTYTWKHVVRYAVVLVCRLHWSASILVRVVVVVPILLLVDLNVRGRYVQTCAVHLLSASPCSYSHVFKEHALVSVDVTDRLIVGEHIRDVPRMVREVRLIHIEGTVQLYELLFHWGVGLSLLLAHLGRIGSRARHLFEWPLH